VELIAGAVWSSETQPIEPQDASQVSKQRLDLLARQTVGDERRKVFAAEVRGARLHRLSKRSCGSSMIARKRLVMRWKTDLHRELVRPIPMLSDRMRRDIAPQVARGHRPETRPGRHHRVVPLP